MRKAMNMSGASFEAANASDERAVLVGSAVVGIEFAIQDCGGLFETVCQSDDVILQSGLKGRGEGNQGKANGTKQGKGNSLHREMQGSMRIDEPAPKVGEDSERITDCLEFDLPRKGEFRTSPVLR